MPGPLMIGVPYTRPFDEGFVTSILGMEKPWPVIWCPLGYLAPDWARQELSERFLNHEAKPEWLLFVDSDATWAPDAVVRLMSRNLPFVVGCMYQRRLPPLPTMGMYSGISPAGWRAYEFKTTTLKILEHAKKHGVGPGCSNALVLPATDGDLLRIDGSGLHFALIHRDVVASMRPPRFRMNQLGGGEDFFFCHRAIELGYTIHADLSVHTGHIVGPSADFGLSELLAFTTHVASVDEVPVSDNLILEVGKW